MCEYHECPVWDEWLPPAEQKVRSSDPAHLVDDLKNSAKQ